MPLVRSASRKPESIPDVGLGREYLVDAYGCAPASLKSKDTLAQLFDRIVTDLGLHPLDHLWHVFPEPGGITGLVLLCESHLSVHTFPESGSATFNLYCCRSRPDWPWAARIRESLGATDVQVRSLRRG